MSVGVDHDTAAFAVETLRRWWRNMGAAAYAGSRRMLVTADAGGSNATRSRLWKTELQRFADETGLAVSVCHFPPGTSKWNKIEHRMFSRIAQNWRGRRMKCTGMRWTVAGANPVLWVRCARLSGWFDDYWDDRLHRAT